MNEILKKISAIGVVPVVKIDDIGTAVPLAKALFDGGIPCAEITFRTAHAPQAMRLIHEALPEMLLGAGTVLTTEQVDIAVECGAQFIVSPGFNPKVVEHCIKKGVPITPGCSTPSDIERAIEYGLDVVKFFPAEASGGLAAIKAMAAPYTSVNFMPTGGISGKNIVEYLSFPRIIACGGSWMVDSALVNSGDFDEIKRLSEQAIKTILGFEIAHVGINAQDSKDAKSIVDLFSIAFGFSANEGKSSYFMNKDIEIMKEPYLGKNGHIAIRTNSIERGMQYLQAKGFAFNQDSAKTDNSGKLVAIYLEQVFGGFAVHLLAKK